MVEEIKLQQPIKEIQEEKNLSEKVNESYNFMKEAREGRINIKKLKIPRKAKARRSKLKKGWIGILKIEENGNISGEKAKIIGGAFKDNNGFYHATDSREVLFWNGKFPVMIQKSWKKNPSNLRLQEGESNETYGQKPIMAKMLGDTIKLKKKTGSLLIWVLVIVGAYLGYQAITGGFS